MRLIVSFLFLWVIGATSVVLAEGTGKKKQTILVLNSYSYDHFWTRSIVGSIYDIFANYPDIQLLSEFMDTKRHNTSEYYNYLYNLYKKKYINTKFDAIVTSDDNAVNFVLQHRAELFPDIPIIFCGVNNINLPERDDFYNITGTLEVPGINDTLKAILYLQPDLNKLYVVNESNTSGESDRRLIEKTLSEYSARFTAIWLEDKSEDEIKKALLRIDKNSAVLLLSYFINKKEGAFTISEGAEFVSKISPVPVYSMWDYFLGKGIIGGMLTSGEYQGKIAASLLLKVLSGVKPENIPVLSSSSNHLFFDYKQLQRFGFSPVDLPQDSIIINQPSSVLRKYRQRFLLAVTVICLLFALCAVLIFNVRARKIAEKSFKESEKRFRAAFDSARDSIAILNADYQYLYVNKTYLEYLGIKSDNIIGRFIDEIIEHIPFYMSEWKKRIDVVFHTGEDLAAQDEFTLSEQTYYTETILTPIMADDEKNVKAVCFVSRDVTERIIAEKEHVELEEKLRHSEKMKSIGCLAGGVAHDFNNILGGIIGAAEIVQNSVRDNSKVKKFTDIILNSAETAAGLTNKLLAFARKQKMLSVSVEINSLIADSIELLRRTVCCCIEIDYNYDSSSYWVMGDSSQLQNVIINLGINAGHAMPDGGVLRITVSSRIITGSYCISCPYDIVPGEYVEIEVSDNGCGIEPENLSKIFDPFFTTRKFGDGTGLGLAAVYGTVRQHKGAIFVESEVGVGTVFTIMLPLSVADTVVEKKINIQLADKGRKILLVDDELVVLETVAEMLSGLGYYVDTAENGWIALNKYKKNSQAYDLVILDMIMPVMNGRKCFAALKEIDSEVKVVMASGVAHDNDIVDMMNDGLLQHIMKPFKRAELSQCLNKYL